MARKTTRDKHRRAKTAGITGRQSKTSGNNSGESFRDNCVVSDAFAITINDVRSRRRTWFFAALIVIGGALAYSNSFDGVMLLDDIIRIKNNPTVHEPVASGAWLGDRLKRPLVSLSVALNYQLGGNSPIGYHIFNLFIHLAAGLTLFGIVRRILHLPRWRDWFGNAAAPIACVIALLWTLHPLQTASVTYIIQRCESMMGLFYLLTIYLVLRGATGQRTKSWYALAVLACLGGMLCKAVMCTAPLMVLLFDRVFLANGFRDILKRRWALYAGLAVTLLFMADGGFLPNMINAVNKLPTTASAPPKGLGGIPPIMYAATQPGVILHYLKLSLIPVGLCFDYWWPVATTASKIVPQSLGILLLLAATGYAFKKRPAIGFCGLWFFLILAPTSSVRPLNSVAFEHRMYLSLAGVIALLVIGGFYVLRRITRNKPEHTAWLMQRGGFSLALLLAVLLGTLTFQRNALFHSELAMWQDVVAQAPHNPRVRSNLSLALARTGEFDEAIDHLEHALQLWPDYGEAHNNMAMCLLRKNRAADALYHAEAALSVWADNPDAHVNKAGALADLGRPQEAIPHYHRVLELKPNYHSIFSDLGAAYAQAGNLDKAIKHYEIALDRNERDHMAINNLGGAYFEMGRLDDAIAKFREALEIENEYADAHHNLGLALKKQGNLPTAIGHYREAIRINPDYADAYNNLGSALLARHEAEAAVESFRKAMELKPNFEIARTNFGHANYFYGIKLEEQQRFDEAVKSYQVALSIIPNHTHAQERLNKLAARDQVAVASED